MAKRLVWLKETYQRIGRHCESLLDEPHAAGITGDLPSLWHCLSYPQLSERRNPDPRVPDEATLFSSAHLGLPQRRSHLPPTGYYVSGWLPLETRSLRSRSVKFALVNPQSCKIHTEVNSWPTTGHFGRNTKIILKKRWNQHGNMSPSPSSIQATLNICFSEKQGQKCCLRFHLLIFALVFLSGVWEQMTNNTEGSTCRSLKVRERYDLSLWLTCAISLRTYSNSWLNPSFSHFSHHSAFAFSLFWSILQDKDLLFIRRSHLDPGRVATGRIWISYDDAFHWKQHEATVNIMSKKHRKISNK